MIDHKHDLPITKQAEALNISRGSVYYLPRPVPDFDLAIMRRLDRLHLEFPFAGSRMLRGLLAAEGCKIGRRHVKTLMRRMGIEALYIVVLAQRSQSPATRSIRTYCADWRSRGRTKCGRWISRTSRWSAALSIWLSCSTRSAAACCRGDCRSQWKQRSALRRSEDALAHHGKPDIFNTDQGSQFTGSLFTGMLANNGIAISMDGKGAWRDNVFVERLWRSVKYEEVYLKAYDNVSEARASISCYLDFYNGRRPHSSLDGMTPDRAYFNPLLLRVAA